MTSQEKIISQEQATSQEKVIFQEKVASQEKATWQEKITAHPFAVLAFSIAAEVAGSTCMKMSEGFTVLPYTIICIAAFALSLTGLVFALKKLPLGLTYGIWGGVGTILTTLIGIVIWNDPFNVSTGIGIVLVIGGVILLNRGQVRES